MEFSVKKRFSSWFLSLPRYIVRNTIMGKLLLALIPSLILLLTVTGFLTYRFSSKFIGTALVRNVQIQNLGQALALESYLEQCRQDVLFIAQSELGPDALRDFLRQRSALNSREYPFVGYISLRDNHHIFYAQHKGKLVALSVDKLGSCSPDPFLFYEQIQSLGKKDVWLSSLVEAVLPFPMGQNANYRLHSPVFFLAAPFFRKEELVGYVLLAVPLGEIHQVVNRYNGESILHRAYPRSSEVRFSFFFTPEGWVLFESGAQGEEKDFYSTENMRGHCSGSIGLPGLKEAFRPNSACGFFWESVAEVKKGKQGVVGLAQEKIFEPSPMLAYAPVFFCERENGKRKIIGGIGFEDRSRLSVAAGYKHIDVMFLLILGASVFCVVLVYFLSWYVTRPLMRLTQAVKNLSITDNRPEFLEIPKAGYETSLLQKAINSMLATTYRQLEEIRVRDRQLESEILREPVSFLPVSDDGEDIRAVDRILGEAPCMQTLRSEILKAAKVDVDILIVGETGTGKQLTAEAVHFCSKRQHKPFISINCGELDENLLMDTLFGHVKGAFTEAKNERKGAFLQAHGGTLFLDEIQLASAKVQQALLRVLALHKVKPLGSDKELDVDVRVTAASNVDLRHLIRARLFRDDLYFRLKVLTIHTPPLREHKEDILPVAMQCLKESEKMTGRKGRILSKGALEKMQNYDWPGNVRELRNCVTRAAVMYESEVLLADHIVLDNESSLPVFVPDDTEKEDVIKESNTDFLDDIKSRQSAQDRYSEDVVELNARQSLAWKRIVKMESITRGQYQELMEKNIAARTAVYDLQDMVEKGLLRKEGSGPATRYVVTGGEKKTRLI